jgi:hypothetical protein
MGEGGLERARFSSQAVRLRGGATGEGRGFVSVRTPMAIDPSPDGYPLAWMGKSAHSMAWHGIH